MRGIAQTGDREEAKMLELNDSESEMVLRVLRNALSDLRMTIVDTENYEWRQTMKRDEDMMKELIGRLEASIGQPLSS
jgi:hypothetical protein